jgi:hypothetical protein
MSTLGLSGSPDKSDGLWRSLFWPTIENALDADLAASRGFWVCMILAFVSAPTSLSGTSISVGVEIGSHLELAIFLFYFLGAIGVRQSSLVASASMFATYFFSSMLYFWLSLTHFSFIRLVGIGLLLANLRAAILIHRWRSNPARHEELEDMRDRSTSTWTDKIANRMPMVIWPWARFVFYLLAPLLLSLECYELAIILMHRS